MRTSHSLSSLSSLGLLAIANLTPRIADACSPVPSYEIHAIDPAHVADVTPPGQVTAVAEVRRDDGSDDSGGWCMPPCGGLGNHIALSLSASDDRTPGDAIGYQIHVVGGAFPAGTDVPLDPVTAPYEGGEIVFRFSGDEAFDVELEIRAVDLNGNLGPPMVLAIDDPGAPVAGGCTAVGASPPVSFGLVGLALAAALRRRRR